MADIIKSIEPIDAIAPADAIKYIGPVDHNGAMHLMFAVSVTDDLGEPHEIKMHTDMGRSPAEFDSEKLSADTVEALAGRVLELARQRVSSEGRQQRADEVQELLDHIEAHKANVLAGRA